MYFYYSKPSFIGLPVILSQSDFVTVILSQGDYVTDGILKTKQALRAYMLTPLYYSIIKIKALTENNSHETNLLSPELSCPNPHSVAKSL